MISIEEISDSSIPIITHEDIITARIAARNMAANMGFSLSEQTRLATAVSELTRNVIKYAGRGCCYLYNLSNSHQLRLSVEIVDNGPGIADINQALKDGFTTSSGSFGVGLSSTKRLMDRFDIESQPGLTKVCIELIRSR